jgi:hypothetical protein
VALLAADRLSECLSSASGSAWPVRCVFPGNDQQLDQSGAGGLVLTDLYDALDASSAGWTATEERLRQRFRALTEDGALTVYLCTLFRHVPVEDDPASRDARRIRIRRLNLLAIEISRETGLIVADIDRELAEIGARTLQTDYRLGGTRGAEAAARTIGGAILATGLDDLAPDAVLSHARKIFAATDPFAEERPAPGAPTGPVTVLGNGIRIRMATAKASSGERAAYVLRGLLKGSMSLREASTLLNRTIARHGARKLLSLVVSGLRRSIWRRAPSG